MVRTSPRDAENALDEMLTLAQTAALLAEDRASLVHLLDTGAIPVVGEGDGRMIRRSDILAYLHARNVVRREALDDLSRLSMEEGLHEVDYRALFPEIS